MSRLFSCFCTLLAVSLLASPLLAKAPMQEKQVPGYYRYQLGAFEITALHDGALDMKAELLHNTEGQEIERLANRMFAGYPVMQGTVNAYLINTGAQLVLVDAGGSKAFNPALGRLLDNLHAAGHSPEQVDMVLLTHMHPDHIGALTDGEGKPLFPNAQVFTSQIENEYWLAEDAEKKSPEARLPMIKAAKAAAAPYKAGNRWQTLADGGSPVTGIKALAAPGHTPGHTMYEVQSEGESLLIWGDIVHVHSVQFAKPGTSIAFDVDGKLAVATRLESMKKAASGKLLVAGMHLPFPGIGHVRMDAEESYAWVPVEYQPLPAAE